MNYKHTQFGWLMVVFCAVVLILFAAFYKPVPAEAKTLVLIPVSIIGLMLILMGTLTVEVARDSVRLKFGIGVIRKTFLLDDIASCQPVRNHWWWGWGIRLIPGGWLFNVSGLDAVELKMKNGRVYRIGTDEPQKLADFIQAKAEHAN